MTISYITTRISDLRTEIFIMKDNLIENSSQQNRFFRGNMPVLKVLREIEAVAVKGLKFEAADFSRNDTTGVSVVLDGKADNESLLSTMTEKLKASKKFSNVIMPVSQKDSTGRIIFRLVLRIRDEQ